MMSKKQKLKKIKPMDILLVDDDRSVLEALELFFTQCGYGIFCACDGVEALEILVQQTDIGLVISDIRMPRMNGIELLENIHLRAPQISVILMTAHTSEHNAAIAQRKNVTAFMKKPVRLDDMLALVKRAEGEKPKG